MSPLGFFLSTNFHAGTLTDTWGANHDPSKLKDEGHLMMPGLLDQARLGRIMDEVSTGFLFWGGGWRV